VAGILIFTRGFGVAGAAAALMVAELVATTLSGIFAKRWLDRNGIEFPWSLLYVALTSIVVAAIVIFLLVAFPHWVIPIVALSLIVNACIAVVYFRRLPPLAIAKVRGIFRRRRPG